MFSQHYRSAHEPEASLMLAKILGLIEGKNKRDSLIRYLRHRDRRLALEMDSSYLNYLLMDVILHEYPDAKFILTLRDCYSWLDSLLNHHFPVYSALGNQSRFHHRKWTRLHDYLFRSQDYQHSPEEQILLAHHLYTVDGYFSYWAKHNRRVIATIPAHRLLVVRTQDIQTSLPKIADFLGIPAESLPRQTRENTRDPSQKLNLLSQINQAFLAEKANQHCHELMAAYFPNIRSPQDAGI